jgi:hypothetical protein
MFPSTGIDWFLNITIGCHMMRLVSPSTVASYKCFEFFYIELKVFSGKQSVIITFLSTIQHVVFRIVSISLYSFLFYLQKYILQSFSDVQFFFHTKNVCLLILFFFLQFLHSVYLAWRPAWLKKRLIRTKSLNPTSVAVCLSGSQ